MVLGRCIQQTRQKINHPDNMRFVYSQSPVQRFDEAY